MAESVVTNCQEMRMFFIFSPIRNECTLSSCGFSLSETGPVKTGAKRVSAGSLEFDFF